MSDIKLDSEYKTIIYKNDLKFLSKVDVDEQVLESDFYDSYSKSDGANEIIFDSDQTQSLYNEYKEKNKLELRIKCCEDENYEYFDISSLYMTDNQLTKLIKINKIKEILKKIQHIDISNNQLNIFPNFEDYPNIKSINVSNNNIKGKIITENYEEIICRENEITCIKSEKLKRLDADNNKIENIKVRDIEILHVNENMINTIESCNSLTYLECIGNRIRSFSGFENLKELYISHNLLESLDTLPNLEILNCTDNPLLKKIHYFPNLKVMMISTENISKQYKIDKQTTDIKKIKKDFFIKLNKEDN